MKTINFIKLLGAIALGKSGEAQQSTPKSITENTAQTDEERQEQSIKIELGDYFCPESFFPTALKDKKGYKCKIDQCSSWKLDQYGNSWKLPMSEWGVSVKSFFLLRSRDSLTVMRLDSFEIDPNIHGTSCDSMVQFSCKKGNIITTGTVWNFYENFMYDEPPIPSCSPGHLPYETASQIMYRPETFRRNSLGSAQLRIFFQRNLEDSEDPEYPNRYVDQYGFLYFVSGSLPDLSKQVAHIEIVFFNDCCGYLLKLYTPDTFFPLYNILIIEGDKVKAYNVVGRCQLIQYTTGGSLFKHFQDLFEVLLRNKPCEKLLEPTHIAREHRTTASENLKRFYRQFKNICETRKLIEDENYIEDPKEDEGFLLVDDFKDDVDPGVLLVEEIKELGLIGLQRLQELGRKGLATVDYC